MTRYGNPMPDKSFGRTFFQGGNRPGRYLKRGRHPQSWFRAAGILSVQERRRSPCGYLRSWGGNVRMSVWYHPISTKNIQARRAAGSPPRLTPSKYSGLIILPAHSQRLMVRSRVNHCKITEILRLHLLPFSH